MLVRTPNSKLFARILLSFSLLFSLSACQKNNETHETNETNINHHNTSLNIGYQKYGVLPIVKARGELERTLKQQGVQVKWVEFPAGPQLLEGLNVGSVVFGEAGEAPPIFAQAAGSAMVYIANQPAAPNSEALIVPKGSAIQSVADLKHKKVALNKGSNVHYLLLRLLETNHLSFKDITPVYLTPADARAAFESGAVDAWVIWDPFLAAAERQLDAQVIANGTDLVNNHQFYLAQRSYATAHPETIHTVIQALNQTTQWIAQHPDQAAQLLAKQTGLQPEIVKRSIQRMGFAVKPLNDDVIQAQQKIADSFYQHQLIPKPLQVKDALTPSNTQ